MQIFKVSDMNFKTNLTNKVLSDLDEYLDLTIKQNVINNLSKSIYFTAQSEYGFNGFISLLDEGEILKIDFIGVFKTFTRQKTGKTLINAAIDFARGNKKKALVVTIKDDLSGDINYLKTRRFFTKMGFVKLATINSNEFFNPALVMGYIL